MEFVSFPIEGNDFAAAGRASRAIKERLKRIGADGEAIRRTMIAAYEAEMNVVIHARRGRLEATIGDLAVDVNVIDEGPGIPDVERAMREGFSTASSEARALGFGAGMGLPNIRRTTDRLRVSSTVGEGTRISFTVHLRPETVAAAPLISLYASADRCIDCRRCITACPTKAVRVRTGLPMVLDHLCIDCTCCIDACGPRALTLEDELTGIGDIVERSSTILAVPTAFAAGFPQHCGAAGVMQALQGLGFATVEPVTPYEEALLGEVLNRADAAHDRRADGAHEAQTAQAGLPLISPACPAVVNLIELRFPSLLPQLAPLASPWEALALAHRDDRVAFVVSCPSQRTALLRLDESNQRDRAGTATGRAAGDAAGSAAAGPAACTDGDAVAQRVIPGTGTRRVRGDDPEWRPGFAWEFLTPGLLAQAVLPLLAGRDLGVATLASGRTPAAGSGATDVDQSTVAVRSAGNGGRAGVLRVTGVRHVLAVLEQLENGLLRDVRVLEPFICDTGCFGSPLLPADPFVAGHAWRLSGAPAPVGAPGEKVAVATLACAGARAYTPRPGIRLDADMARAVAKLARLEEVTRSLPGKDCGACGAPTCASLAEDVVMERALRESCPYLHEEVTTS